MNSNLQVNMYGHLKVIEHFDDKPSVCLVDKANAIHPQNMSRIIARALSNEGNFYIRRMAFGNGGTTQDGALNIIYNRPNDGTISGWEDRLYNETYSEIVDESDSLFKEDPGSSESGNFRIGGGAVPSGDPSGGGTSSQEVGTTSIVSISVFLNKDEPTGQLPDQAAFGPTVDSAERCFVFDEIGLYSAGKPAAATNGFTRVDVGNKTSENYIDNILPSTTYDFSINVDGIVRTCQLTTPASGSGPMGELTYGDLCEGINTNAWISSGDLIGDYIYAYITDYTNGDYISIIAKQSYGFLVFQSLTSGTSSSASVECDSDNTDEFFNVLTGGVCANCNINPVQGDSAGVQNDPNNPENERERLLTHVIFTPIAKSGDREIEILYEITVSVSKTKDSQVIQNIS